MALMTVLSFVIGYPLFMLFVYFVAKVIFTPLDKIAVEQEREKMQLLKKARRVRRSERVKVREEIGIVRLVEA
jgi:hypothetical protein